MAKGLFGFILIIIAVIVLFTGILNQIIDLDGYTVKQTKELCDSWIGDLGKTFNTGVRKECGIVDVVYYSSLGLIVIGSLFMLVSLIVPKEKKENNTKIQKPIPNQNIPKKLSVEPKEDKPKQKVKKETEKDILNLGIFKISTVSKKK